MISRQVWIRQTFFVFAHEITPFLKDARFLGESWFKPLKYVKKLFFLRKFFFKQALIEWMIHKKNMKMTYSYDVWYKKINFNWCCFSLASFIFAMETDRK